MLVVAIDASAGVIVAVLVVQATAITEHQFVERLPGNDDIKENRSPHSLLNTQEVRGQVPAGRLTTPSMVGSMCVAHI